MRLSSVRIAFLRPKARAISRAPTLPGRSPMKARMSALEGGEEVFFVCLLKIEIPTPKRRDAANVIMQADHASYSAAVTLARRAGFVFAAAAFFGLTAREAAALPETLLRPATRRLFGALPILAARASSSPIACSSVTVSGVMSAGSVALMPAWLTYGP